MQENTKSLKGRHSTYSDSFHQLDVLSQSINEQVGHMSFSHKLREVNLFPLKPTKIEIFQINVGKKIQKLRELKGLSQQDLATKCNFEKSNMSRLEAGRVNTTLSTLEKVAKALDVTLIELFNF